MDRTPMTKKGHESLQEELHRLKTVERVQCTKAIEEARAHGDLSENAEYDAAKEAQGMCEARIREIELKLSTAQVIDVTTLSGEKVVFGANVKVFDLNKEEEKDLYIVGEDEADASNGLISYKSPLAKAFIGCEEGDYVKVHLPSGIGEYEIMKVSFEEISK